MSKRTKILAIAAGVVVLASIIVGSVALAADPTPTPKPGTAVTAPQDVFLAKLAARLNITVDQLKTAMTGARTDTVNQLAAEGKITPEQKDAILNGQVGYGCGMGGGWAGRAPGAVGPGTGYGMMGGYGRGMMRNWGGVPPATK